MQVCTMCYTVICRDWKIWRGSKTRYSLIFYDVQDENSFHAVLASEHFCLQSTSPREFFINRVKSKQKFLKNILDTNIVHKTCSYLMYLQLEVVQGSNTRYLFRTTPQVDAGGPSGQPFRGIFLTQSWSVIDFLDHIRVWCRLS